MEMKKVAEYVVQGFNEKKLKEQVIDHNIFQVKSEARKKEIAATILMRFNVLSDYLMKQMITTDVQTSKIIALYTILKTDRLFYEYMHEVFSEKVSLKDLIITDRDFNIFFEGKRKQSKRVASWQPYTFYKLQQVYIRILFEAGLLQSQKGMRNIIIPIIDQDILEHLRQVDDPKFIDVIVGGESV